MKHHQTSLTRREAIRRAALLAGASGLPFGCTPASESIPGNSSPSAWETVPAVAVDAPGYGSDPNLLHPVPVPWPLTLSDAHRHTLSVLADILIPADEFSPAASAVGVIDVLDEWVSAPYPDQQAHHTELLSGLDWLARESNRRFAREFVELDEPARLQIIDDIAFAESAGSAYARPAEFFDNFRRLVTGIFYTSPEGTAELGYMGNVAISGPWPGPTQEAIQHLQEQLSLLGLRL